jgi:hypothetical protein
MARRPAVSRRPSPALERWVPGLDGLLRLQSSYLGRVAEYTTQVGTLAATRSVDPAAWVNNYAGFLSGVVSDVGDWMLEREGLALQAAVPVFHVEARRKKRLRLVSLRAAGAMAFLRGKVRTKEGTTWVRVHVPAAVFAGLPGQNPKVTLVTDGLFPSVGGTPLTGTHVRFVPAKVSRTSPETDLSISDVAGAVNKGETYRGLIWVKETGQTIAAVELAVL